MSGKRSMVKELHCKMCTEKFSGPNRLVAALVHLKNFHSGIFERRREKSAASSLNSIDLSSSVVTSTDSSPDLSTKVSTHTQTDEENINEKNTDKTSITLKSFVYPVPGQMKTYFSISDYTSFRPYKCHKCDANLKNLKLCVIHLSKEHGVAFKQNQACNSDNTVTDTDKHKQTARKSTASPKEHASVNPKIKAMNARKRKARLVAAERKRATLKLERQKRRHRMYRKAWRKKQELTYDATELVAANSGALSPEDCFRSSCSDGMPSCEEGDSSVEEGSVVLQDGDDSSTETEDVAKISQHNFVSSSQISEEADSKSWEATAVLRDDSSNQVCASWPAKKTASTSSLWNSLSYNSTLSLPSNKVDSSSLLPSKVASNSLPSSKVITSGKRRDSSFEGSSLRRNSATHRPCMESVPLGVHSSAMLKQLKTNKLAGGTISVAKSQLALKKSNSDSKMHRPLTESKSSPCVIAPIEEQCIKKKTARKTTRPSKVKLPTQQQESPAVQDYLRTFENETFVAELEKFPTSPDTTQESVLHYAIDHINSYVSRHYSADGNSPTSSSSGDLLNRPGTSGVTMKKATGRKSVRSKY